MLASIATYTILLCEAEVHQGVHKYFDRIYLLKGCPQYNMAYSVLFLAYET